MYVIHIETYMYGYFVLSYEDMKTFCYISFTKNTGNFTSNNFLKCVQVKKLCCIVFLPT